MRALSVVILSGLSLIGAPAVTTASDGDLLANTTGTIAVAGQPVTLPLAQGGEPLVARLAALGQAARLFLVVSGIRADVPSGTTYNVFLGLRNGNGDVGPADRHYAGTFGLFNVAAAGDAGASVTFDVTEMVSSLVDADALDDPLFVTVVPMGAVGKSITIGAVALSSR